MTQAENADIASLQPYADWFSRPVEAVHADLLDLREQVKRWQKVQNLVSRETLDQIWTRHILDSLQLLPTIAATVAPQNGVEASQKSGGIARISASFADIGSGGGFPALPLAIALKDSGSQFQLIESHGRKCAFLTAMGRAFDLPLKVHNARIEAIDPQSLGRIDIFTSRALASLPLLFSYLDHLWQPGSRSVLHKGREKAEEMRLADSEWAYDVLEHKSRTDDGAAILEISNLRRR